jgi:hypothetical protein
MPADSSDAATIQGVRLLIMSAIALALIVIEVELIYVGHTGANNGQLIAVVLVAVGLATATWHTIARNTASIVVFRINMYLFLVFGLDGILTHYHAGVQSALKSQPALSGFPLLVAALSGNIPLLAPGMLIQVGLLGLVYTYNHPLDARVGKSVGSLRLR